MSPIFTLITALRYIDPPQGLAAWLAIAVLFGVTLFLLFSWRRYNQKFTLGKWLLFFGLAILAALASLFLGFRLPAGGGLPLPGVPLQPEGPVIMIFAAVPWMLAGGLLGPLPAALLALLQGFLSAGYYTHSPFTPLELTLTAITFSAAVRQCYRTPTYRLLRHPLAAAIAAAALFALIHLATTPFTSKGMLVTRLDYAMTNLGGIALAAFIEMVAGGLLAEFFAMIASRYWSVAGPLQPSPAERSLRMRFIVSMSPLAVFLIVALIAGDWYVATKVAREMLNQQMAGAAKMASSGIPYFLETGQELVQRLAADPQLAEADAQALQPILVDSLRQTAFFNQLTVLDKNGVIASYPTRYYVGDDAPNELLMGVQTVFNGMPFQAYTVRPSAGQTTAQVAFITAIKDKNGSVIRVLEGHSDLGTNPFIQPALTSLNSLTGIDGQGMIVDEDKHILAGPDPQRIWEKYLGDIPTEASLFDGTALDGTRQIVYFQPSEGRPWSVIVTVPAYRVQQVALQVAVPLLAIIAILTLFGLVVVRISLGVITRSLQNLAGEAGRLAEGRLDRPVTVDSTDEVGQLSRAFEQMRASLKARLDDLNRLLTVSKGVASSLEIAEAVQPVLESALGAGGASARVVLTPAIMPGMDGNSPEPVAYGYGPAQSQYHYLDEQILALTRQQDRLVLSNLYRPRLVNLTPGAARPESLIALSLKHENQYYGALWVAYDQPHTFSEEEVRFLATLSGQVAMAAANARLFTSAEIGRKRLESILASTPDPVLVTDQHDCMLLANPAAWQVLGLGMDANEGQPVDQVVSDAALLDLLHSNNPEKQTTEIYLPGGRVYLASATSVVAEGMRVGRVCVLRDITHFKELDELKSEFVSTVSHDLRSPLTLMRGYATMLEMVGQLNDQQVGYVRKIIAGVESMSRLVNNLLDLGRIEAGVGLQLETVPVVEVVERVVGALQLQAAQKHITLTTEVPPHTMPMIEADQALLQQAVQNLVENAIKYTKQNGKVLVRVQIQPQGLLIQVIDNGIGISPVDLPRLFEKFYRGAQGVIKEQRGTGLGLAIVRSIAERHGGRAWAESQLGKGSSFYMTLPMKQAVKKVAEPV